MNLNIKNIFSKLLLILMMSFSLSAFSSELTQPKKDGIIGERFDGYVGIVKSASAEIKDLVAKTNERRKEAYKELAVKKQLPLNKIEIIAGETNMNKTLAGNYIMLSEGDWQKK